MANRGRPKIGQKVQVTLGADEIRLLEKWCKKQGISRSEMLRNLVKYAFQFQLWRG